MRDSTRARTSAEYSSCACSGEAPTVSSLTARIGSGVGSLREQPTSAVAAISEMARGSGRTQEKTPYRGVRGVESVRFGSPTGESLVHMLMAASKNN